MMQKFESREVVKRVASLSLMGLFTIAATVIAAAWPYIQPQDASFEGTVFGTVFLTVVASALWFVTGSEAERLCRDYL